MPEDSLIECVARKRVEMVREEIMPVCPDASVSCVVRKDRAVITIQEDRFIIGREFVESEDTWNQNDRLLEYAKILINKARLVVIVPKDRAVKARMRMLELNHHWLCYYMVYYYDEEGNLRHMDRAQWLKLMGVCPSPERSPEIS